MLDLGETMNKRHALLARSFSAAALVLSVGAGVVSLSAPAGASSKVTITIWNDALAASSSTVPNAKSFLTKGVALFEKANPNIKVNVLPEPMASSTGFNTLLSSSELAGSTPDIGQLYVGGQILQNAKYLVGLNQYLGSSYIKSLTGWQFVSKNFQTGSTIYAVPYGAGYYYTVFFNKALFKKAGISTTTYPTTWAGLLTLAGKLKAKGITPFEFGEKEGYFGAWSQDALISMLGGNEGVLAMNSGKTSLNSSLLLKPYNAWHGLWAAGYTNSNAPSLTFTTGVANFAAGKAAMTITGNFYATQFYQGLKSNVGLFPVPALPGSKYPKALSGGPNNAYVIFKTSKHVADDVKLIKFLTSKTVQDNSINELGQLPNIVGWTAPSGFNAAQPLLADLNTFINKDHYTLMEAFDNVMPGSIDNYWYQTNTGVFAGTLSSASAAGSMQNQMQSYLSAQATSGG